jgi:primosomal protein N' (replication factor Y)
MVLVQTQAPRHYALEAAARHDYEAFAQSEIPQREALGYPPFARLICVLAQGQSEEGTQKALEGLKERLAAEGVVGEAIEALGPTPARVERARGRYRFQLLFKVPLDPAASAPLRAALKTAKAPRGVAFAIDVDPFLS